MPVPALRSLAQESGRSLRELERYWQEAKKQAKKHRKEGTSSFFRYVMGIVKRRAGLSESKAEKLLNVMDENSTDAINETFELTPDQIDFADSIIPQSEHMVPITEVKDLIRRMMGQRGEAQFMDLLIYGSIPENREGFINFFKDRHDMVSKACYEKLLDAEPPEINIHP